MFQGGSFWFFLAAVVVVYWNLPMRLRGGFLALVSLFYLISLDPRGPLLAFALALTCYLLAPRVAWSARSQSVAATLLCLGTFAILAYFKYSPQLAIELGYERSRHLLLPLGISYFAFKLIHYVIERWRGTLPPHGLGNFIGYILLFPTFTIGPIERFDHYLTHRTTSWSRENTVEGLWRIVHGLIKRFALVDVVLPVVWGPLPSVDQLLSDLSTQHPTVVWWYLIRCYIYAYLEFSAYSDMAIGSSLLFGIRILENFRFPIVATSISDYWQRWHMTLAGWCQSYVYMPLLGATRNPYLATYLAFIAIGLWHAGTLQWLVWGTYHATGIAAHVAWRRYKMKRRLTRFQGTAWSMAGWLATQLFVSAAYAFTCTFPSHTFHDSLRIFVRLFGGILDG